MIALVLAALLAAPQAPPAEARVVEYLKANVKPGQPVVVSELYNTVFTGPEERAALNRLFNTFFKMPLYMAQHQKAAGKPPTLAEISEQFRFQVPGEADVMLRIMESDPRMPKFMTRDAADRRDHERGRRGDPGPPEVRQGSRADDHGLGRPAGARLQRDHLRRQAAASRSRSPGSRTSSTSGSRAARRACGPHRSSRSSTGPTRRRASVIVGLNADRVLEIPTTDEDRAAYAKRHGWTFTLAHMTPRRRRPTARSASSRRCSSSTGRARS